MFSGWSSGWTRVAHDLPFLAPRSTVRMMSRSRARGPSSRNSTPESFNRSLTARCSPKRLRAISIGGFSPAAAAARSDVLTRAIHARLASSGPSLEPKCEPSTYR